MALSMACTLIGERQVVGTTAPVSPPSHSSDVFLMVCREGLMNAGGGAILRRCDDDRCVFDQRYADVGQG
ncbi:MAG: hypothetical protein VX589_19155 [Myxococcota bacterium]|nr:hypothetical protein [Myxococcota bacterium]